MDVKTVCLGLLSDGEASGYDLKKQFESTFGHFFAAGFGSIYPALSALANDGLVDCREIAQEGKPDRKVYRITDAGLDQLRRALTKPDPSHKVRSEFLAMMWFAHLMADESINEVLDHRLAEIDRDLGVIHQFETTCLQDASPGMRFVCGCGKAVMQAMRKHIEDKRAELLHDHAERAASA
ncbi:MAG: PadR family transcriptional regulator [Woeseiaceae bacterium]|nr:PadR family transcriptional regulator [Woeseiaceae bacterium]